MLYFAGCLPMSFVNRQFQWCKLLTWNREGVDESCFRVSSIPLGSNDAWETEDLLLQQREQSYLFYCSLRCQHSHVRNTTDKRAYTMAVVHPHLNGNPRICISSLWLTLKKKTKNRVFKSDISEAAPKIFYVFIYE